jgi:hypothetical protein
MFRIGAVKHAQAYRQWIIQDKLNQLISVEQNKHMDDGSPWLHACPRDTPSLPMRLNETLFFFLP